MFARERNEVKRKREFFNTLQLKTCLRTGLQAGALAKFKKRREKQGAANRMVGLRVGVKCAAFCYRGSFGSKHCDVDEQDFYGKWWWWTCHLSHVQEPCKRYTANSFCRPFRTRKFYKWHVNASRRPRESQHSFWYFFTSGRISPVLGLNTVHNLHRAVATPLRTTNKASLQQSKRITSGWAD